MKERTYERSLLCNGKTYRYQGLVIAYLTKRLSDYQYTLFRNAQVTDNSGKVFEFDVIVVGDGIIYSLEVKHFSGKITAYDDKWRLGSGNIIPNPINQARYKAKILAQKLRDYSPALRETFVEPLVVLVGNNTEIALGENRLIK